MNLLPGLPKFGRGPCLGRLNELLDRLEVDRQRLAARSVVICGSNGKGSTAAYCETIARQRGYSTGLFTSPHHYDYRERFQLNRQWVDIVTLRRTQQAVIDAIEDHPRALDFGSFEAQFAIACLLFQNADCQMQIFEAGIGGRFDPVRLVGAQRVAICSIDLEHTELLGETRNAIAKDKSDACHPGGLLLAGTNLADLEAELSAYNRDRGVELKLLQAVPNEDYLQHNARLALELMSHLKPAHAQAAQSIQLPDLVKSSTWPLRMEELQQHPLVVVDAAHTPDGVRAAIQALDLRYPNKDFLAVVGISVDKSAQPMLEQVAQRFDSIVLTQAAHKGTPAARLAKHLKASSGVTLTHDVAGAVGLAKNWISRPAKSLDPEPSDASVQAIHTERPARAERAVFVLGGLFLAAEFATLWRNGDARVLKFM